MTYGEIAALATAIGAIAAGVWAATRWTLDLREKRRVDEYVRKERVYKDIVIGLQALYRSGNPQEKEKFIEQTRATWIYCPDDVVRALNECLDALIVAPVESSPQQKAQQKALGKAVAAMRSDLMPNTTLTGDDFRHVSA